MIKVTVGEQKTQSEKPFPKLMIATKGIWKDQICFFEKEMQCMLVGQENSATHLTLIWPLSPTTTNQ